MRKIDVISHFGTISGVARAIGVTSQAVSQWPEIIPRGSAYIVQAITDGKLKVDSSLYPRKRRPLSAAAPDGRPGEAA